MNELKEFMQSHLTARIKKFYRSAGGRSTAGYLKGIMGIGEEETPAGTVIWGTRGIHIRKWYTWQEADQIVRNIMEGRDREIDALASMQCEQLSLFGN